MGETLLGLDPNELALPLAGSLILEVVVRGTKLSNLVVVVKFKITGISVRYDSLTS